MRSKLLAGLSVVGTVTILVLAANTVAIAATGKGFLLGRTNTTSRATTLTRTTPGVALQVRTKSSTNPPLAVNGRGRVTNLNADSVDGLDSSRLLNEPYVVTRTVTTPAYVTTIELKVPVGTYLVNYSAYLRTPSTSPSTPIELLDCYLVETDAANNGISYAGESTTASPYEIAGATGSAVVTKRKPTDKIKLVCNAQQKSITVEKQPIQVVLTRVDRSLPLAGRLAAPATK
jgi:hypothetical protein